MKTAFQLSIAALFAIPVSFAAVAASAQVAVAVGDIDFHKADQLAAFNARIQEAAHSYCAGQNPTGTRVTNLGPCVREVVKEAYDSLDAAHKRDITVAGDKIVLKGLASR